MDTTPNRLEGTVVSTVIEGRPIRFFVADPNDHIQSHHMKGEFYEREELAIIQKYCPTDAHVMDIGANVGNHAIFFDKFLAPRSVRVIEVNPLAIAVLRLNIALNDCRSVDLAWLGRGIARERGRLSLVQFQADNWGGAQFAPAPDGKFDALPGDALATGLPVGFLKIDVERMELDVLAGLEQTIETWRPPMFIEIADPQSAAFAAWLNARNYTVAIRCQRYPGVINYMAIPA